MKKICLIAAFPGKSNPAPGEYDFVDGYQLSQENSFPMVDGEDFEALVAELQQESPNAFYALVDVDDNGAMSVIDWA